MEWEEVQAKHKDLYEEVKQYNKKKKLTKEEYNQLLKFLVLSLYVELPPRRNDYQQMKIKTEKEEDNKYNYLDLVNKQFIFNNFKTAKVEGQKKITIPDNLYKIIQFYLKFKPDNKEDYFLVNHKGDKLNSINGITRILNNIFNKNIGSSLLRHFYLSSKYSNIKQEQAKDAELMSHTTKTQDEQYIKKK
jgi:integrase